MLAFMLFELRAQVKVQTRQADLVNGLFPCFCPFWTRRLSGKPSSGFEYRLRRHVSGR